VRINFENGCVANVTASRISDKKVRKFRIFQKNAYINIDFLKKQTDIFALTPEMENSLQIASFKLSETNEKSIYYKKLVTEDANAMLEEQKDFIHSINNNKSPLVTGEDGLAALKLALSIEKVIQKNLEKVKL
jgi:predicted dehydrogenase